MHPKGCFFIPRLGTPTPGGESPRTIRVRSFSFRVSYCSRLKNNRFWIGAAEGAKDAVRPSESPCVHQIEMHPEGCFFIPRLGTRTPGGESPRTIRVRSFSFRVSYCSRLKNNRFWMGATEGAKDAVCPPKSLCVHQTESGRNSRPGSFSFPGLCARV